MEIRPLCEHADVPGAKAASLVNMPVVRRDPYPVLEAALRSHVIRSVGGDPDRDVNALAIYRDATGCLYHGTWNGHLWLTARVAIDSARVADVLLIATKGSMPATDAIFGKTGPNVGNSILVARLLHAALFALRSADVVGVRNDPFDARVRRLYEDMGFHGGTYLPLGDVAALTKTFAYIAKVYQHPAAVGRLSLASPPLPL